MYFNRKLLWFLTASGHHSNKQVQIPHWEIAWRHDTRKVDSRKMCGSLPSQVFMRYSHSDVTCSQPGNVSDTWNTCDLTWLLWWTVSAGLDHSTSPVQCKMGSHGYIESLWSYPHKGASSRISESNLVRRMRGLNLSWVSALRNVTPLIEHMSSLETVRCFKL